jgi:hypothetical protein
MAGSCGVQAPRRVCLGAVEDVGEDLSEGKESLGKDGRMGRGRLGECDRGVEWGMGAVCR